MTSWADRYVEKVKKDNVSDDEKLRAQAVLREQVVAQAPHLWEEVKRNLFERVKQVEDQLPNHLKIQQFHGEGLGISQTVKITSPTRQLEISYYDGVPKIEFEFRELRGLSGQRIVTFAFRAANGEVDLVPSDFSYHSMTPGLAAEYILETLER